MSVSFALMGVISFYVIAGEISLTLPFYEEWYSFLNIIMY